MRAKITKRVVDALEEGIAWDPELRGFGVRARLSGGKYYMLKFRSGGKQRWHTIGRHGSPWTPEQARKEAKRVLGELAAGKAPSGEARATVTDAVDGFIEAHCRHLRSGAQTAFLLRKHTVGRWGGRRVASIGHHDVVVLLREVQGDDRTKRTYIANRVRAALSRFFKWAISEALLPSRENPVAGTEPRRGEIKREVCCDERGDRERLERGCRLAVRRHRASVAGDGTAARRSRGELHPVSVDTTLSRREPRGAV